MAGSESSRGPVLAAHFRAIEDSDLATLIFMLSSEESTTLGIDEPAGQLAQKTDSLDREQLGANAFLDLGRM